MIWWTSGLRSRSARAATAPAVALTRLLQVEDVDRAVARAELGEPVPRPPRDAARAAPRAACSSGSPRASSAASVAECVQPAPWVARDLVPLDRDLDVPLAVEEVVDRLVAVAAGDDHGRRAELVRAARPARACGRRRRRARLASCRFGVTTVASGNSRVDERLDRVVLEQLARRSSRP